MLRRYSKLLVAAAIAACIASPSHAGQVRVTVGPGSVDTFSGRFANANVGDQIVWVWASAGHSTTSGDSESVTPDFKFDSGIIGVNGAGFSWRVTSTGVFPYYCDPHAPDMASRVIVNGAAIPVSDFRITEVQYNEASGHDLIEISNVGAATGDLGRYRISKAAASATILPPTSAPYTMLVAPGATVTVHTNEAGTNTASDLFLATIGALSDVSGSVALYVPANAATSGLSSVDQIIDYVEWGATGGANETTAINAGYWGAGASVPGVAVGHSIEYCGQPFQRGASHWYDSSAPSFSGTPNDCATPTHTSSWGRIKALYR